MLSYIKLKKNPHNFLQLTGLKVSEFDNIVNLLHEPWSKIESKKNVTEYRRIYQHYKTYISHTCPYIYLTQYMQKSNKTTTWL